MYELNNSISSNVSKLVEEQIRSKESFEKHADYQENMMKEQDKKLDNIQRNRKPPLY